MDGARHKLLSGAGLAKHKNACRGLGNDFDQFLKFFSRRGLADDDVVYRDARHNTHPTKQQYKRR